jgi:hypothetical protein
MRRHPGGIQLSGTTAEDPGQSPVPATTGDPCGVGERELRHFASLLRSLARTDSRSLLSLAFANYVLDWFCAYLLSLCCDSLGVDGELALWRNDLGQADTLFGRPSTSPPLRPEAFLREMRTKIEGFRSHWTQLERRASGAAPRLPTMTDIDGYVASNLCNYSQLGYGLYRTLSSDRRHGEVSVIRSPMGTHVYNACNCLAQTLISAVIGENLGLPEAQICRAQTRPVACALIRSLHPNLRFPANHLSARPGLSALEDYPLAKSATTHPARCGHEETEFDFLFLPLEWIIVDAAGYEIPAATVGGRSGGSSYLSRTCDASGAYVRSLKELRRLLYLEFYEREPGPPWGGPSKATRHFAVV